MIIQQMVMNPLIIVKIKGFPPFKYSVKMLLSTF